LLNGLGAVGPWRQSPLPVRLYSSRERRPDNRNRLAYLPLDHAQADINADWLVRVPGRFTPELPGYYL